MREVKKPEIRRNEIIDISKKLFQEKGYLNTTTQDIISGLGISRGLLYYHFKSKEDILFYIVKMHIEPILSHFKIITNNKDLNARQKVISFINSTIIADDLSENDINKTIQEAIDLPENTYMVDKINHKLTYAMTDYFSKILEEGNTDGTLKVEFPYECAAFLMTSFSFVMNDTYFHNNDKIKATRYFNSFKIILNQTLGADELLFEL